MIQGRRVISTIGSRMYMNQDRFVEIVTDRLNAIDGRTVILLSGGCDGPDVWGRELSRSRNIPFIEVIPGGNDSDHYFERNSIVSSLADEVIAFIPRGQMKSGTWNTILYFRAKSKSYTVYDENGDIWDRDWRQRSWKTIEHPGFFGKMRDDLYDRWNRRYGRTMWRIAYVWGDAVIERDLAIQLYEDAYYKFFSDNHDILKWLVETASDVYDNDVSNTRSGTNYDIQETSSTHIQDISVRRVLRRNGLWFRGDRLVQIRSNDREGKILSPKNVPFHLPDMIYNGEIEDHSEKGIWWNAGSVEDFYQRNKILQVLQ